MTSELLFDFDKEAKSGQIVVGVLILDTINSYDLLVFCKIPPSTLIFCPCIIRMMIFADSASSSIQEIKSKHMRPGLIIITCSDCLYRSI